MKVLKSPVRPWGDEKGRKIQQVVTEEAVISTRKYGESGLLIRSIYYGKIAPDINHQYLYDPYESSVDIEGQASVTLNRDDLCYEPVDPVTLYNTGEKICWSSEFERGTFYQITSVDNRPGVDENIYMKNWKKISNFSLEDYPEGVNHSTERYNKENNVTKDRSLLDEDPLKKYYPDNWWEDPWGLASSLKEQFDNSDKSEQSIIESPKKYKIKFIDKITNFNPSTDTLEIDTASFSIDNSATFASGKNKKVVKKKLAKQDFEFLYDEKKGGLYFNENGSDKGFGDGGLIAILKDAPDLSNNNLEFI
jgi:hypothetical protein